MCYTSIGCGTRKACGECSRARTAPRIVRPTRAAVARPLCTRSCGSECSSSRRLSCGCSPHPFRCLPPLVSRCALLSSPLRSGPRSLFLLVPFPFVLFRNVNPSGVWRSVTRGVRMPPTVGFHSIASYCIPIRNETSRCTSASALSSMIRSSFGLLRSGPMRDPHACRAVCTCASLNSRAAPRATTYA